MDRDYYHSRLDKAKEAMIASRMEEALSLRDSESKKKKKHKDDRLSHDGSRRSRDKKKRSRSRDSRKHKKHQKNRDSPDRHNSHQSKENKHHRRENNEQDRHPRRREQWQSRGGEYRQNRGPRRRQEQQRPVEEKDPYYQKRREIEEVRRSDPEEAQRLQNQLEKQIIFDNKERELKQAQEKFKQAQKEMEEAKREDLTILVYCLPLKAKEKDIWNFFSKTNCGKIRDIRIIRDARSGRSKGVAYVQFYTSEAVQRALTMTDRPFELKGRQFMGLRVQHSQAEKNRAAQAAKQLRVIKPADPIEQQQQQIRRQTKVFVSGLVDKLQQITQKDLKQLFEPFGEIEYVDIHRDPQTGKCKGYAFIQYSDTQKARSAVKEMNGLTITGTQKISVQLITVQQRGDVTSGQDFLYSAGAKAHLRNNLSGSTGPSYSNLQRPPISTVTTPYLIMTNMFKMEGTTPAFFEEMKKEVQKQTEEYGVVQRIFIEKNNQGNIWIKYSDTASALKAQQNLNGKFFDGHKIFCYFVTENTYQTRMNSFVKEILDLIFELILFFSFRILPMFDRPELEPKGLICHEKTGTHYSQGHDDSIVYEVQMEREYVSRLKIQREKIETLYTKYDVLLKDLKSKDCQIKEKDKTISNLESKCKSLSNAYQESTTFKQLNQDMKSQNINLQKAIAELEQSYAFLHGQYRSKEVVTCQKYDQMENLNDQLMNKLRSLTKKYQEREQEFEDKYCKLNQCFENFKLQAKKAKETLLEENQIFKAAILQKEEENRLLKKQNQCLNAKIIELESYINELSLENDEKVEQLHKQKKCQVRVLKNQLQNMKELNYSLQRKWQKLREESEVKECALQQLNVILQEHDKQNCEAIQVLKHQFAQERAILKEQVVQYQNHIQKLQRKIAEMVRREQGLHGRIKKYEVCMDAKRNLRQIEQQELDRINRLLNMS